MTFFRFFILILLAVESLSAVGPIDLKLGPQCYHVTRKRNGGTEQRGLLGGVSGTVERRKRNGIYVAADGYYASGILRGNTSVNKDLDSRYIEAQIEGRAGFTAHSRYVHRLDMTPYLGYGYFTAKNRLRPPSPIPLEFHDEYVFLGAGLLTRVVLDDCFSLALNFTSQYSFEGTSKITNDPAFDDQSLKMGEVMQFQAEAPLRYVGCFCGWPITSTIGFFYRYRIYDKRENYPFDFIKTQFHVYGAKWVFGTYF